MNKVNYNLLTEKIISGLSAGEKPSLLLHSCCAPCSSAVIERLKEYFNITVYYYNPNIDTKEEYELRSNEQKRLCSLMGVECVVEEYDGDEYISAVKGLESEKEGGGRCRVCFLLRLKKTAEYAKKVSADYFSTTLTISPLKNAELINSIGLEIEKDLGVKFLPSDFKKKGGYLRSIELSREYGLYTQNYCGCIFSKQERAKAH